MPETLAELPEGAGQVQRELERHQLGEQKPQEVPLQLLNPEEGPHVRLRPCLLKNKEGENLRAAVLY